MFDAARLTRCVGGVKKKSSNYIVPPEVYRHFTDRVPSKEEIITFVDDFSLGKICAKPIPNIPQDSPQSIPVIPVVEKKKADPIPEVKPVKVIINSEISKVKSASVFSLTNMLKPKSEVAQSTSERQDLPREKFGITQLNTLWDKYADLAQLKGHQGLFIAMKSADLTLKDENEIEVAVGSNTIAKEIEDKAFDVFLYLKKELRNHYIRHSLVVRKTEKELLPYTQREIYDFLLKKNPKLSQLKDKLKINIQ